MAQLGFYFDQTKCTGCKCCYIACKDCNDLPVEVEFRHVTHYEGGSHPEVWTASLSLACNHCANPACVANCPSGAMTKDEETGLVAPDPEVCIGCGTCVNSCPYGAPVLREGETKVSAKCDGCQSGYLPMKGKPACVLACSTRALQFGDLEELKSQFGEGAVSDLSVLPDSSQTSPSLFIRPKDQMI